MHDFMYEPLRFTVNVEPDIIMIDNKNNVLSFMAEGYFMVEAINSIPSFHRIEIAREIIEGTGYEIKEENKC